MLKRWRLRRLHEKYLESSRNLKEGREYWSHSSGVGFRILKLLSPVPLLSLHGEGGLLLRALQKLEEECASRALTEAGIRQFHETLHPSGDPNGGKYRRGQSTVVDSKVFRP